MNFGSSPRSNVDQHFVTPPRPNRDEDREALQCSNQNVRAVTPTHASHDARVSTPPRSNCDENLVAPPRSNRDVKLTTPPRPEDVAHGARLDIATCSDTISVYAFSTRILDGTNATRIAYGVYFGADDANNCSELPEGNSVRRIEMVAVLHALRTAFDKKIVCANMNLVIYTNSLVRYLAPVARLLTFFALHSIHSKGSSF